MIVNTKQAVQHIITSLKANLVTMLSGPPGIGKSAIIFDIAEQFKLEVIDIRLSQYDVVDLNGFPCINSDIATYVPMDIFPIAGRTKIPKGKKGFLIFLDEFNSASLAVQAAAYKLVLDKQVGQHNLHKDAYIVCAGNLATDNAIVNRLSTAMQTRLIHLELAPDIELWTAWASKKGIDHRIISYVHHRPEHLFKFDANHNDKTFACPRTWDFVSQLLKHITGSLRDAIPLLAGTIGEPIAREFITHTEVFVNLPSIDDILRNPTGAILNENPAMMYAVCHMVAAHADKVKLPAIMKYVNRFPLEFQTITLQDIIRRDEEMLQEEPIVDWINVKGEELF